MPNVKSQDQAAEQEIKLRDSYLDHIDKAFEQTAHKTLSVLSLHQQTNPDDILESPEGQLILFSLSTPLFTHKNKSWLTSRLEEHYQLALPAATSNIECSSSSGEEGKTTGVTELAHNLVNLAKDLLEAFSVGPGCSDLCKLYYYYSPKPNI